MTVRVAVAGAAGRMGEAVCRAVEGADDLELTGRADPALDTPLESVLGDADVVVDFTRPDTALENVRACLRAGVHAVVGTSGWDHAAVDGESGANVFFAPNFAIGAVLMMRFAAEASKHMAKAEIVELLASAYPERFAAIAPVCGFGDPGAARRLASLPAWVFHGARDDLVPLQASQEMVDALKEVGNEAKFTIYPEAGHDSWTPTYNNPALFDWLLSHRRKKAGTPEAN